MTWLWVLVVILGAGAGAFAGYTYRKQATETKIGRTEEYAKHLYDDAVRKADEYKKEKVLEIVPTEPEDTQVSRSLGQDYVVNTNTDKFHYPGCASVSQMKDKNRMDFTGTREELIAMGYEPCKNCNP